jgi:chromosomal replication initiation ATPase DnaA
MPDVNIWATILSRLKADLDPEEFRRWLSNSSYASDSGDQISVWIPSAAEGRHVAQNYMDRIERELARLGRANTTVRFITTGYLEDEDEEEENERR